MQSNRNVIGFSQKASIEDVLCVMLGRFGFSYNLIQRQTHLSKAQIALRLKQTGIKLKEYRNGQTSSSKTIINCCHNESINLLENIKKELKQLK